MDKIRYVYFEGVGGWKKPFKDKIRVFSNVIYVAVDEINGLNNVGGW